MSKMLIHIVFQTATEYLLEKMIAVSVTQMFDWDVETDANRIAIF